MPGVEPRAGDDVGCQQATPGAPPYAETFETRWKRLRVYKNTRNL